MPWIREARQIGRIACGYGRGQDGGDIIGMQFGELLGKRLPAIRGGFPDGHDFRRLLLFPLPHVMALALGKDVHTSHQSLRDEMCGGLTSCGHVGKRTPNEQCRGVHFLRTMIPCRFMRLSPLGSSAGEMMMR